MLKNKKQIKQWLDKTGIENYTIRADDGVDVVDVAGNVNISEQELIHIPVQFGVVHGDFVCYNNQLTSLKGAPKKVSGDYVCSLNKLTSLEFAPKEVGGNFYCTANQLTSLKGALKEVGGSFDCGYNKLTSLEFAPKEVGGYFDCDRNKLKDLHMIHTHIHSINGNLELNDNSIRKSVLGIFLIDGLKNIVIDNKQIRDILNKHLKGNRDPLECGEELIDLGYEEYAQF